MGTSRIVSNVLSATARPIGTAEFAAALSKILGVSQVGCHGQPTAIGLAVSGGVDSIALATLCSQLQRPASLKSSYEAEASDSPVLKSLQNLKFQAFIVDHGLRPGSDTEAQSVSMVLENRGIQTRILKIEWPGDQKPAKMPNFESMARRYRFRVLGKACRDSKISSLLLAHHEDDQAETVLMRIIKGHRMTGLLGIKAVSEIPECYGMHGVHESGDLHQCAEEAQPCPPIDSPTTIATWENVSKNSPQLPAETGGIRVYRPLLNFSKARLIATCQADKTEWFEDATNKDPTLTMRNTIRHMYSSHSMPAALTKPALLALTAKLQEKSNHQIDIVKSWLSKCSNCHLNTRTGTLQIRFPDLGKLQESVSTTLPKDSGLIAARLLRHVIRLVTPKEHIELSSLHGPVERIFPELLSQQEPPVAPIVFTVCGVLFQPLTVTSIEQDLSISTQKCTWLISCQLYPSSSSMRPSVFFSPTGSTWSAWTLYDGRYWIRIQNHCMETIHVRPFHKDDMSDFRHDIDEKYEAKLRRVLKSAPGSVRWTLPAIALRTGDGNEKVIALPSLGLALPKSEDLAKWEIRYKKINTADLPMVEIPVIKHSQRKGLGVIGSSLKS